MTYTTTTSPAVTARSRPRIGDWIVAVAAILGFVEAVLNYFSAAGIAGSEGALLVVISTALILLAIALFRWWRGMPRWLGVVLGVLVVLDFVGTAVAGYFLEAYLLVALMVIALVAWAFTAVTRRSPMERRL